MKTITDYFTSGPNSEISISDYYRAKILISSSLTGGILLVPFTIAWGIWGDFTGVQFNLLVIALFTLFSTPYLFKKTKSIAIAGIYVNCVSTILIVIFTFYDGGLYSTAIPWFPVLPIFAVFYSGKKYGLTIAGVLIIYLIALLGMHLANVIPPMQADSIFLVIVYAGSTASAVILLVVLAFNYLAWQDAVRTEIYQADKAKSEFLSGISHELRTPLHSILGFTEILKQQYIGDLNDKQGEFLGHIYTSGEHLLQLVNNLLDITRIEAGIVEFSPAPASINSIIEDSVTIVSESAVKKNINLNFHLEFENPKRLILLDELKIKQVVINLLSNAIKFTPNHGEISLSAKHDSQQLIIDIKDSGPGIPEAHRDDIFERFVQVHHENSNKDPGSGLGLAISKHFIEMHGGTIELKDEEPGARFTCYIPLDSSKHTNKTA